MSSLPSSLPSCLSLALIPSVLFLGGPEGDPKINPLIENTYAALLGSVQTLIDRHNRQATATSGHPVLLSYYYFSPIQMGNKPTKVLLWVGFEHQRNKKFQRKCKQTVVADMTPAWNRIRTIDTRCMHPSSVMS